MIKKTICVAALLALAGCISIGGGAPPQHTTVVVPQGSTTCVNHDGTACTPQ